jgi:phospholipid/cholesterol/gamma-HCH transport system substrate-binding protein
VVNRLPYRRAAAAALVLASSVLGGACSFGRGGAITVDAIFKDIGDLPRFANVQAADVKIGTVRSIKLDGYHARVSMRIDKDVPIPANAEALIRSTSLLGEKFIDLRPPEGVSASPQILKDGDVIPIERTERIPGIDDAFIRLARLLEGGTSADLATVIHSSATILRGREEALGELFTELSRFSGVLAGHAPDVASAIDNLDHAFSTLAGGAETIARALSSSADATSILAQQQTQLDNLVGSLDRASAVLARYGKATRPASDAALKDLRRVLDQAMKATGDLDKTLSALARFVDLWPRAIPGDYIQLDIVLTLTQTPPSGFSAASAAAGNREFTRLRTLADLLWGATR